MNRSLAFLLPAALVAGIVPGVASAATLSVGVDQTYATIQGAIDASVSGDIVAVQPGTYVENINFGGRAITVQSTGGRDATIIDGGGAGTTVAFGSGEGASSLLIGFTITGGSNSGINIFLGSGPTVRDCLVTGNGAENGGGINVWGPATISQNEIVGNQAAQGGGIFINHISAQVKGNVIRDNAAASGAGVYLNTGSLQGAVVTGNESSGYGGGIFARSGTSVTNALVTENTATFGGGVHISNGTNVRLTNLTIDGNSALGTFGAGGGVHIASGASGSLRNLIVTSNSAASGGGIYSDGSNPAQFYLNVYGNTAANFGGNAVNPGSVNGNLSADPLFSDFFAFALTSGSPSVDAGDPARSFEDPDGSVNDMGYFGGPGAIWAPYADSDSDGVHLADGDCDDTNAGNFPGNAEICDGADNDCNDVIDDGLNDDLDGDTFSICAGDCDDADAGVFPGNVEIPDDGIDQDCDGADASEGGCNQSPNSGAGGLALALMGLVSMTIIRRRR